MEQAEFALALQHDSSFPGWVNFHFLGDIPLLLPLRSPNIILILRETPFSIILQIPNSLLIHLSTYSSLFMHSLLYMRFCYWVKNILEKLESKSLVAKNKKNVFIVCKVVISNEVSWKIALWYFSWVKEWKILQFKKRT